MRIWPWSTIKDLRFHIKALEYEREAMKRQLVEAQMHINAHQSALDEKTKQHEKSQGHLKFLTTALAIKEGFAKVSIILLLLVAFGASAQTILRNLWTTNGYDAHNPVVAVTSLTVSNLTSSWTVQPNGTNTTATGIQTNAYGNNYTNQFQLQTIDMRNSRTTFGLFANQFALTNNFQISSGDDSTYFGFASGFTENGTFQAFNTAIGAYALSTDTNGAGNTAIGQKAMANGTNCQSSVAIGAKAMASCLAPARDYFSGYAAGQFALGGDISGPGTGGNRVGIGYNAGEYDSGQNNVWIGENAGPTSGSVTPQNIIGIGVNVLSGIGNSANGGTVVGCQSGGSLAQFIGVLIGNNTLNSATGNFGTWVGDSGGQSINGTWNRGTALGSSVGGGWTGSPIGAMLLGYACGNGVINESNQICILGSADANAFLTDFFFNAALNSSATTLGVNIHGAGGNGNNAGGAPIGLYGGLSTGNANGGNINFAITLPGTSGTTQNTATNSASISGNNGVFSSYIGFASYATNQTTISTGGWTNSGSKTLRIFGFTGTSVIFSNSVSKLNFSMGTITSPTFLTLNPKESVTGTSCAASGTVDF